MKGILLCEGNAEHPMEDCSAGWVCMEVEGRKFHVLFLWSGIVESMYACDGSCERPMVEVPLRVEEFVRKRTFDICGPPPPKQGV